MVIKSEKGRPLPFPFQSTLSKSTLKMKYSSKTIIEVLACLCANMRDCC